MKGLRSRLAHGASWVLLFRVAGTGLLLLLHVFLARRLGPGGYGDLAYVLAWLPLLVFAGRMGMDKAAVRFPAAYTADARWGELRGFMRFASATVLLASLLCAVFASLFLVGLHSRIPPALWGTLAIGVLIMPAQALLEYLAAFLRGLERVRLGVLAGHLIRPGLIFLTVVVAAFALGEAFSVHVAIGAHLGGILATLAFAYFLYRWNLPAAALRSEPTFRVREWLGAGTGLMAFAGLQLVLSKTDMLLLGALRGTTDAGIYGVGQRLAELMTLALFAVNAVYSPLIAQYHARGEPGQLQKLATSAIQVIAFIAIPLALGLAGFGYWIVVWLFGPEYANAYPVLVVLVLGQLVNALAGSVGLLMTMTGHHRPATYLVGAAAGINVILNLALIPPFGMMGAAIATAGTKVLWNGLLILAVAKYLGIDPTIWGAVRGKGRSEAGG